MQFARAEFHTTTNQPGTWHATLSGHLKGACAGFLQGQRACQQQPLTWRPALLMGCTATALHHPPQQHPSIIWMAFMSAPLYIRPTPQSTTPCSSRQGQQAWWTLPAGRVPCQTIALLVASAAQGLCHCQAAACSSSISSRRRSRQAPLGRTVEVLPLHPQQGRCQALGRAAHGSTGRRPAMGSGAPRIQVGGLWSLCAVPGLAEG